MNKLWLPIKGGPALSLNLLISLYLTHVKLISSCLANRVKALVHLI